MEKKTVKICTLSIILLLTISPLNNLTAKGETQNQDKKEHWAVIIAGGEKNNSFTNKKTARHAYETFKKLGYNDEHIYLLQDKNTTEKGVDGITNKSTFKYAITGWLKNNTDEKDDCFFYFVGHGGRKILDDRYRIGLHNKRGEIGRVFAEELKEWFNQLSCNVCTIMLDTCESGGFIKSLSKPNRIVITSTSKLILGYGVGEILFSYYFFNKLEDSVSYGEAWEYADRKYGIPVKPPIELVEEKSKFIQKSASCKKEIQPELPFALLWLITKLALLYQNPQIDDNGDGKGHGRIFFSDTLPIKGDGTLALNTYP